MAAAVLAPRPAPPAPARPGPSTAAWWRDVVLGGGEVLAALLAAPLLHRRFDRWGTVRQERTTALPGDELVPEPALGYTRALTIDAPPEAVWPWLVQIGQGRGGLYSFDGLENLLGCDLRSADEIRPELQALAPGDVVRLHPAEGAPWYRVDRVCAPTTLVLVGGDGRTRTTWQSALRPMGGGLRTRLLVRQRLSYPPGQGLLWRLVAPVGFVMERRMLRGLRHRAEAG